MALVTLGPSQDADFFSGRTQVVESVYYEFESIWIHDWSLLLTLDGRGKIVFGEHRVESEPGDMLLIAPEHPHRFQPEPGWDLVWFHFLMRPHLTADLHWPERFPGLRSRRFEGAEFRRVKTALLEAMSLDHRRPFHWHGLACALLEGALLRGCVGSPDENSRSEWLARAQRLLLQNAEANQSIDRAAALCGMSRTMFYAVFKRAAGMSPRAYREFTLMRRAQFLLQSTSLSVAVVARQLGMEDPFYFSTRFRRFCGQSPSEYRRKKRNAVTS